MVGCSQGTHAHIQLLFQWGFAALCAAGAREGRDGQQPAAGSLPALSGACQHHRLCRWRPASKRRPQTSQAGWQVLSQLCSQGQSQGDTQSPDTVLESLLPAVTLPFLPSPGELGRLKHYLGFYSFIHSLLLQNSSGAGASLSITLGTEFAPLAGSSAQQLPVLGTAALPQAAMPGLRASPSCPHTPLRLDTAASLGAWQGRATRQVFWCLLTAAK